MSHIRHLISAGGLRNVQREHFHTASSFFFCCAVFCFAASSLGPAAESGSVPELSSSSAQSPKRMVLLVRRPLAGRAGVLFAFLCRSCCSSVSGAGTSAFCTFCLSLSPMPSVSSSEELCSTSRARFVEGIVVESGDVVRIAVLCRIEFDDDKPKTTSHTTFLNGYNNTHLVAT